MQRPAFSQSPNRVGSGPSRPPISRGSAGDGGRVVPSEAAGWPVTPADAASGAGCEAFGSSGGRIVISRLVCQIGSIISTARGPAPPMQ